MTPTWGAYSAPSDLLAGGEGLEELLRHLFPPPNFQTPSEMKSWLRSWLVNREEGTEKEGTGRKGGNWI